jgi:hypothetical protein
MVLAPNISNRIATGRVVILALGRLRALFTPEDNAQTFKLEGKRQTGVLP